MLKTGMMMLAAMVLVGGSALRAEAATAPQATPEAGNAVTGPEAGWQVAHVAQWDHYHQCDPSPCKRLRDRHKKGTGSVTE